MDWLLRTKLLVQGPDQVDQRRIHLGFFIAPPIAHEVVELLERFLIVFAFPLERDGQAFLGVNFV